MMRPEDALEQARSEAVRRRAAGGYAEDLSGMQIEPTARVSVDKLMEWSLIEPDVDGVYSTRRWGRPITAFKHALIWALRQYNGQVYGQQTRFNHHIVLYASRLEDRVSELEAKLAALEAERGGDAPS